MRKLAILALIAIAIMALATTASAQGQFELGVYFDTAGTQPEGTVAAQAPPTSLYLMMVNLGSPIEGYELGLTIAGPFNENWIVCSPDARLVRSCAWDC